MASRFTSALRRPVVLGSLAVVGGTTAYAITKANSRTHSIPDPVAPVRRDATGRIVPPSFSSVKSRAENLADLRRSAEEEFDLLIIGGGATGTGIAVDAVTRGLKVALVERDDFSSGTSSKSTKLVHGGVRYLEKAVLNLDYPQLELVIEALRERKTFLNVAPHLSNSLPILLPLQKWWEAPYMWCGTKAYDLLAGSQGLEGSYFLPKGKALASFPLLRKENLVGALVYYDGQHNDSRMNVSLAMTASLLGATVLNHAEVTSLEKDPSTGRITGAAVRDVLAGDGTTEASPFRVRAKGVINATGPFTDAVEHMDDPTRKSIVAPASGAHVMLPGDVCPNGMGMLSASSDGRVVFVLPWQGKTLAGTTDEACAVEREPVALQKDVDFILREVNKLLSPESALSRDHVHSAWSGIRPLVKDPNAKNTESLVRSHLVTVSSSGLLTCAGGKWTTYRQMAQDAVDEAVKTFRLQPQAVALPDISGAGLPAFTTTGRCVTLTTPLVGAHGFSRELAAQLLEVHPDLDADVALHLAANYGDRAWSVLSSPDASATRRLVPSFPFIEAELRHGIRAEAACTAADLVARRTRLAFLDVDQALAALPRVIDVLAEELGWADQRREQEWTHAVGFFRSMGLPQDRLGVTREQVEARQAPAAAVGQKHGPVQGWSQQPPVPAVGTGGGGVNAGLDELQNGTITARNISN